ncbi:YbhN family protein [Actinokineospora soli]|uniref:YbhN family protein n=1 Tax=Actinokineospora soli TaxID=1048753 RepID=A0ABW2TTP2_9PSEU
MNLRPWWPVLRVGVALALLVALVWRFGVGAFGDGFAAVSVGNVLAALGIGVVSTVACAVRWWVVARRFGLGLSVGAAVASYYQSQVLNAVLPAGVLGDVHRAVSHGAREGAVGRGVRAVVWERGVGQVVLVVVTVLLLALEPLLPIPDSLVVIALALALGVAVWRRRDIRQLGLPALAAAAALSLAAIACYLALFLLAARSTGVAAPLTTVVVLGAAALLVMALPLSIGGWGPREAFLAAAFGTAGLGADAGLKTAILYGVLALVSTLPGLPLLLHRRQVPRESPDEVRQDRLPLRSGAQ